MSYLQNVSHETQEKINFYYERLVFWNKSLQLIQNKTLEDFWERHVNDSLQLLPFLKEGSLVDLGSGAGLPGIILALADPSRKIVLLESNKKKHAFHLEIIAMLGLKNVTSICDRIENASLSFPNVVSRALAPLHKLLELSQNVSCETSRLVFSKGARIQEEIKTAQEKWMFDYILSNSLTSDMGRILQIEMSSVVRK